MGWKDRARRLNDEIYVLYLALKDPRVPWYTRALAIIIAAYAISPVDLIPEFIPVIGYLDDLIIVAAGIYLVRRMIPRNILEEYRLKTKTRPVGGRGRWVAAGVVVVVWMLLLFLIVRVFWL